jgi:hypothetical protein
LWCTPCRGSGIGELPPAGPRRVLRARSGPKVSREQATGPRGAGRVSQAAAGRARVVRAGRARFRPISNFKLKILFYSFIQFQLNSNFKKLYLNIQSSKNYEISSFRFIIF